MKTIYLVSDCFIPNCASINRLLALVKGFSEYNINIKVYFLFPSKNNDEVKAIYNNVDFVYLWKYCNIKNKYICSLYSILSLFKILKRDIPIIFYGCINFLWFYRLKRHIRIYHERTEYPQYKNRHLSLFEKIKYKVYLLTCKKLDGLFVISPSLKDFFVNEVNVDKKKVIIINMVVDIDRFQSIVRNEQSQYISYCGTISENKDGVDILVKSFVQIHNKYSNYILQLIGPFENKEVENKLRNLVKKYNLENFVCFKGVVSSLEMPHILANSKLLVLSRPNNKQAQYGFPTKLGEYLMTGVPVLITNVGDMYYYLKDKESIIFVEPNSIYSFAEGMQRVFNNYDKALQIGLKGKEVALTCFNNYIESDKILQIILNKRED